MKNKDKTTIDRREFLGVAALGASAAALLKEEKTDAAARPNIIYILADDLGAADLSCYGQPGYKTPNIDRLAREGMRFTQSYSGAPVCTPTRVSFQTGRYPARLPVGLFEPLPDRAGLGERTRTAGIPVDHPTVGTLIKAAGYDTALVGKWHLGYVPEFGPLKQGYDEFFGFLSGAADYFSHKDMEGLPDLWEGEVPVERSGYLTDLFTDRAIEFMRKPRKKPFYLNINYNSPHWPWEGPLDERISRTLKGGYNNWVAGGSLKIYGEMMKNLDANVGRLLLALKAARLDRTTLVIFNSDNGGERFSYNWPFSGMKFDLHEGGIRVPAIIRWPGVVKPGTSSEQPVITMDWTATLLSAAGTRPDAKYPLDGEDMTPTLAGKRKLFDRTFYWRTNRQGAVLSGKWKYIKQEKLEELHDLSVDEREQADFSESHPQVLEKLRRQFQDWEATVLKYPPRPAA
jgi:arylsulfatase A-like enzyme